MDVKKYLLTGIFTTGLAIAGFIGCVEAEEGRIVYDNTTTDSNDREFLNTGYVTHLDSEDKRHLLAFRYQENCWPGLFDGAEFPLTSLRNRMVVEDKTTGTKYIFVDTNVERDLDEAYYSNDRLEKIVIITEDDRTVYFAEKEYTSSQQDQHREQMFEVGNRLYNSLRIRINRRLLNEQSAIEQDIYDKREEEFQEKFKSMPRI